MTRSDLFKVNRLISAKAAARSRRDIARAVRDLREVRRMADEAIEFLPGHALKTEYRGELLNVTAFCRWLLQKANMTGREERP